MATTNKTCPKGQYWNGKKCVKQLNEGVFNDIGTRAKASLVKFGESWMAMPKEARTIEDQEALNKDKALHLSNAAKAKEEAKKQAAYKAKVKAMQTGPNGYQKKGGSVGTKKTKMAMGGVKKYQNGGGFKEKFKPVLKKADVVPTPSEPSNFSKRQSRKIEKAKTRAMVASVEGYDNVSKKRSNRADNVAKVLGTSRVKVPKRLSTSNSTSVSNTDNRNSGNTSNITSSGSTAGADANSSSNSAVTNGNTRAKSRPGRTGKSTSKKMQMGGPVKNGTSMMKKSGIKKK
jgi:hypothetical protein